eukprot:scaffold13012_cov109-Isochrysis_galbana.AAC.4
MLILIFVLLCALLPPPVIRAFKQLHSARTTDAKSSPPAAPHTSLMGWSYSARAHTTHPLTRHCGLSLRARRRRFQPPALLPTAPSHPLTRQIRTRPARLALPPAATRAASPTACVRSRIPPRWSPPATPGSRAPPPPAAAQPLPARSPLPIRAPAASHPTAATPNSS